MLPSIYSIDGVSENLWSAEGVLGGLEALSLYDSPDTAGQRKNFQGDFENGIIDEAEVEDLDEDEDDDNDDDQHHRRHREQSTPKREISTLPTPANTPSPSAGRNDLNDDQPQKRVKSDKTCTKENVSTDLKSNIS